MGVRVQNPTDHLFLDHYKPETGSIRSKYQTYTGDTRYVGR